MSNYEIISDVVTHNTLISGFCRVRGLKAMRCEVVPNIQISILYAISLDSLCKNLQFIKAMLLFQETEDKKLYLNIPIYNILINGTCSAGKRTLLYHHIPRYCSIKFNKSHTWYMHRQIQSSRCPFSLINKKRCLGKKENVGVWFCSKKMLYLWVLRNPKKCCTCLVLF